MKSQLTTLKIYSESVSSRIICGTLNLDKSFLPNYTLKHLYLDSNSCCHLPKITKYFRGLETLVNYEVCATTVDNIFKYQRQLRRLALINDHKSDFSSRNLSTLCKSSTQWFEEENLEPYCNLTHLSLEDCPCLALVKSILCKFALPNLVSFTLSVKIKKSRTVNSNFNTDQFWQIVQKFTQLEYIYLDTEWKTVPSFEQWSTVFCALPNLHHFYCLGYTIGNLQERKQLINFNDSEYRKLFQMYPSLRTIVHHRTKYFKDVPSYK